MSCIPYESKPMTYEESKYYFEQIESPTQGESSSFFYNFMRVLSIIVVLGFLTLFILSLSKISTLNWSIGLVGLLGSIGLSGAIWLSKNIVNN